MAHKVLIGGTAYGIKGGKTMVNGTVYSIKKGRTLVGGTGYDILFSETYIVSVSAWTYSEGYIRIFINNKFYTDLDAFTGDDTPARIAIKVNFGDTIMLDVISLGYVSHTESAFKDVSASDFKFTATVIGDGEIVYSA